MHRTNIESSGKCLTVEAPTDRDQQLGTVCEESRKTRQSQASGYPDKPTSQSQCRTRKTLSGQPHINLKRKDKLKEDNDMGGVPAQASMEISTGEFCSLLIRRITIPSRAWADSDGASDSCADTIPHYFLIIEDSECICNGFWGPLLVSLVGRVPAWKIRVKK